MSSIKDFIFGIGILSALFFTAVFCSSQIAEAKTSVDYSLVDVSALQNQYQRQLKPKAVKKVVAKKPAKRGQVQSDVLLQYQRLLANQQTEKVRKQQDKRSYAIKPVRKPIQQIQAQERVQPKVRQQRAPAPANKPVPRRDAIFEAASAGDVRLIGQLLSQGVNVNQANNERETALHMAAAKGHYSAVIYLLNNGANINGRTINNWLPIHHATRFRHAQIANYLKQKGSQIYAKTSDGLSAVDMAKALNDRRILGIFGVR
ncbi:MAG: ankyrin repeat domain-containing protein [Cocleimonas sp.]